MLLNVSGSKTADFRSRKPHDSWEAISEEDVPVKLRLGIRTAKAQKLQSVKAKLAVLGSSSQLTSVSMGGATFSSSKTGIVGF